ncbi:SDR family NAD(P)-dependent oxidoreductase [Streptomyces sp. enrichment culture]|uniref:SDR family NAD(P)-dependent oxidoreductase n=1 Tax=Streptomyces sp. enrichment culture TaxID=1795815 RepID=UPI003F565B87
MKTVVITGGTSGIGRDLARTYLDRGERAVVIGTNKTRSEPSALFLQADLELIDENRRLIDQLPAELDTIDVLILGARFQRSRRTESADGLESNFALSYLSRFLLNFPGTVATSFAGAYDEAEAAQIGRLRATGKPVEAAVREILPFLDSGSPGRPVAVSEGIAISLDPQASSPADARRLYAYTREVLVR